MHHVLFLLCLLFLYIRDVKLKYTVGKIIKLGQSHRPKLIFIEKIFLHMLF